MVMNTCAKQMHFVLAVEAGKMVKELTNAGKTDEEIRKNKKLQRLWTAMEVLEEYLDKPKEAIDELIN
jgi:hypothetical protein